MSATTPCPDPSQLGELLAGRLSEDAQAALAEHLESCASCRNALDAMADGGELDGLAGRGEATVGPAFDEAIAKLRAEGASSETMGVPGTDGELSLDFLTPSDDPDLLGRHSKSWLRPEAAPSSSFLCVVIDQTSRSSVAAKAPAGRRCGGVTPQENRHEQASSIVVRRAIWYNGDRDVSVNFIR